MRGSEFCRHFQVENHPADAWFCFRHPNLLDKAIAYAECLDTALRRDRRTQSAQVEEQARRRIQMVEGDFILAMRLNGNTRDVSEGPESNRFDMRIGRGGGYARLRAQSCSRDSGSGKNPAGEAEHSGI